MKQESFYPSPYGDQDNGRRYLGAAWALVMCALISTSIRVWVRGRLTRNMGWDDHFMIIAQFTNLVGLGFVTAEVFDGLGRHMYYLQPDQRRRFQIIGWLDWMQTFITIMFTKISICLFLKRIKNDRTNRIFMYSLIAANVLVTAVICFLFLDLILATMPFFFLRNIQISLRTKILLCVLMGAGYITAGCSLVRTVLSDRVLNPDLTWAILTNAAWRATEVNLGIVCANAPIARPLYLYYKGRLRIQNPSSTERSSTEKSHARLWPWSRRQHDQQSSHVPAKNSRVDILKGSQPENQPTDTTLTSVEMGLPIQGYMMKDGKRHSRWVDLEEAKREVDRAREKGEEIHKDNRRDKGDDHEKEEAIDVVAEGLGVGKDGGTWTARERFENKQGFTGLRRGVRGPESSMS
ncbi:MAG: hypothetical protein LQ350_006512 [Teloschistes chrysophthalmus]|nr:MAG: hypothetical protein LQ350_006512 [Niorma chrysophthalma]